MPTKMKRRDIRLLAQAIPAMGGRAKAVEVDGKARIVVEPYDVTPAGRYALGRTAKHLRDEIEAIDDGLGQIVRDQTKDADHPHGCDSIDEEHPNWNALQRAHRAFLREEAEVTLHLCSEADLKPDANKLPGDLLAMLAPMLKDWDRKAGESTEA